MPSYEAWTERMAEKEDFPMHPVELCIWVPEAALDLVPLHVIGDRALMIGARREA